MARQIGEFNEERVQNESRHGRLA
ncbi:hypothetical protein EMIT0196MI5_150131 [Pseudomonas sp. IT-196MI5]